MGVGTNGTSVMWLWTASAVCPAMAPGAWESLLLWVEGQPPVWSQVESWVVGGPGSVSCTAPSWKSR